jgi:antitoxin ParD1/3/4
MATMNISLPDTMKDWVEAQTVDGRYGNSSDVVRDLIRREQIRLEKIENIQRMIDDGIASGICDQSVEDITAEARREFLERQTITGA